MVIFVNKVWYFHATLIFVTEAMNMFMVYKLFLKRPAQNGTNEKNAGVEKAARSKCRGEKHRVENAAPSRRSG